MKIAISIWVFQSHLHQHDSSMTSWKYSNRMKSWYGFLVLFRTGGVKQSQFDAPSISWWWYWKHVILQWTNSNPFRIYRTEIGYTVLKYEGFSWESSVNKPSKLPQSHQTFYPGFTAMTPMRLSKFHPLGIMNLPGTKVLCSQDDLSSPQRNNMRESMQKPLPRRERLHWQIKHLTNI